MQSKMLNTKLISAVLAGFLLSAGATSAAAVDVYLQTESYTKTLTDSLGVDQYVPMWGFICDPDAVSNPACVASGAAQPQIDVIAGDSLTIHLDNTLTVPVSIVIPGQSENAGGAPVMEPDTQARMRVRSLTSETAPGGSAMYTWDNLSAGTYLYQSGTHQSLQVPMGLYGTLVVIQGAGQAYSDVAYDNDAVLLFSEIDPLQNARVAATAALPAPANEMKPACVSMDDYLADATVGYPCTIDYNPLYFLVNDNATPDLANLGGVSSSSVLLRLVNAGLRTHSPSLVGLEMTLVAEDGNRYPGNALEQSQALLPAGKTLDALVTMPADSGCIPPAVCTYDGLALIDRGPKFSNESLPNGGSLATLFPGAVIELPPGLPNFAYEYQLQEDTELAFSNSVAPDLFLDAWIVSGPSNGTIEPVGGGSLFFKYIPNSDFSGVDAFHYLRGGVLYAKVKLNVMSVNDAPVAVDDSYASSIGGSIVIAAPGVLANDADIDGDTLMVDTTTVGAPASGGTVALLADGSFEYTPPSAGFAGTDSFAYTATDGTLTSPAVVTLTVTPASNITLNVWEAPPVGVEPTVPVTSYRWLVQEDRTFNPDPSSPPSPAERVDATQSLNFHNSYMPIVATGCMDCIEPQTDPDVPPVVAPDVPFSMAALDPTKHYYLSVLPNDAGTGEGHTIGGVQIPPGSNGATLDVFVNSQEVPTAQLSVLVFDDTFPTNGFPDGNEPGLGGFEITLEDAGGRYGISGGAMSQDAFGNPLKNYLFEEDPLNCPLSGGPAPAGAIVTCPDGRALIKNLPPAKYGVFATPSLGDEGNWTQTSTIEGSKVIDAWVEAGNSPLLVEFGVTTPHAFIGFVNPSALANPGGPNTVTGSVTLLHDPRPPSLIGSVDSGSYNALSHTRAWVGVNSTAGDGVNIKTVHADGDGNFTLDGLPNGTHQLVVWDDYLNQIIAYQTVILDDSSVDVGNVPINAWFNRFENNVYLDDGCGDINLANNGIRDICASGDLEAPLPEQAINLRWRDGTVNQSFPTDLEGFVPFDSVFPFFSWQVVEVDYTRFKATGLTVTVDAGGDVSGNGGIPGRDYTGILNPQVQTDGELTRTETGPVLTHAYQGFAGQTSVFDWGKAPYQDGENGGISGIVFYASTRGENDPRLTAGDPWEPGVPGVKVRLYREVARQFDQDNAPTGNFPGAEDVDYNGNGLIDFGTGLALMEETTTDSWDESKPTGCVGENPGSDFALNMLEGDDTRCFDGMRNWNQARPGVFDGGYAFGAEDHLAPGNYVVEVEVPPGYELYKEEDVNVGFGDAFGPNAGTGFAPVSVTLPNGMLALVIPDQAMIEAAKGFQVGIAQPPCVGVYHVVPQELSLFPGEAAPFAAAARPLCDRKRVFVSDKGQAAADFHLFTATPVAAQFTGLTLDDLTNEDNTSSPNYGEKWGAGNMPIAIRDYKGRQLYRGYTDPYGRFSGLMPSTFSANLPIPSGYSPAMNLTCMNDAGDGAVPDPRRLERYGMACYTLQYMPGTTTYVDTPIIPTAAFAGGFNPADCAAPQGTPVIASVGNYTAGTFGPLVAPGQTIEIFSAGPNVEVPNPAYDGPLGAEPPTINRDFGFGAGGGPNRGIVELVESDGTRHTLTTLNGGNGWNPNRIRAIAPATPMVGQLVVTRGDGVNDGNASVSAVTVTVGTETPIRVAAGGSIQDAIDTAPNGSLILVESGAYMEQVVMWKPVRLQGSGSETLINAVKQPKQVAEWTAKVTMLVNPDGNPATDDGVVDLLPGQDPTFANEVGAGVTVLAKRTGPNRFAVHSSRIDGFTIINANIGGGMVVNGWATDLEISNNRITGNSGSLHGGIRVGHAFLPGLEARVNPNSGVVAGFNVRVNIHHNEITLNGGVGFEGNGGGLSLSTGTNSYKVSHNFICGNLTLGDGAGIGHLGQSNNGLIEFNQILFNQSFNPDRNPSGGGILIAGEPPVGGALTLGSGNVIVDGNLVQGNEAGSGHGAGIRTQFVNGAEIALRAALPSPRSPWRVRMTNNVIVNNVAGFSGAGISLQDTINGQIINNTIANNDSTAAAGPLIIGGSSDPQPAGISSAIHSPALGAELGDPGGFSSPVPGVFINNIVWHNRAFFWDGTALQPVLTPAAVGDCPTPADINTYWDLGVLGQPQANPTLRLDPRRSILTTLGAYAGGNNIAGDPAFLDGYCNGTRSLTNPGPMGSTPAFGEGGNFLNVRWGPLTQAWPAGSAPWDYHIGAGSIAVDSTWVGSFLDHDIDNQARPGGSSSANRIIDRGADEQLP